MTPADQTLHLGPGILSPPISFWDANSICSGSPRSMYAASAISESWIMPGVWLSHSMFPG